MIYIAIPVSTRSNAKPRQNIYEFSKYRFTLESISNFINTQVGNVQYIFEQRE